MFGSFKPVVFDPYGRRARKRVPRWLILLLLGIAAGALAVLIVQERYLPPRLSAAASTELRQSFERAESERTRLARELADTARRLEAAVAEKAGLVKELATSRSAVERLRDDNMALVGSLPPDPRGGEVEVRAARFAVEGGALAYDVVLSRARTRKPFGGVMQVVVAGTSAKGADTTVALKPVAINVAAYESLRGSLALPEGFKPRQATIQLLDKPDGRRAGMRVINVQ